MDNDQGRLSRKQQHRLTRSRILDAAERIFARDGYRGATVDAIAEAAGYSHGAVYSSFKGKHDLFLALIAERVDVRLAKVFDAGEAELRQGATLERTGRRYMEVIERERDAIVLLVDFWNQAVRDPTDAQVFAARHARLRAVASAILQQAAQARDYRLTIPAEHLATVFICLFNGFAIERLADPASVPDDLLNRAINALIRGLSDQAG